MAIVFRNHALSTELAVKAPLMARPVIGKFFSFFFFLTVYTAACELESIAAAGADKSVDDGSRSDTDGRSLEADDGASGGDGMQTTPGKDGVSYVPSAGNRVLQLINDHWKFYKGDVEGAEKTSFNDSTWDPVSLPHTWNNLDGQDGNNDYYRGIGWYRKTYKIADQYRDRELFLQFDAVNQRADVYVNGTYVGTHKGGFSRFRMDVTPYWQFGVENLIAVKASNRYDVEVCPLNADFTFFGGIYRDVYLLAVDKLHFQALDFGSDGVFVTQKSLTDQSADLEIKTKIRNDYERSKEVRVRAVVAGDGQVIVQDLMETRIVDKWSDLEIVQHAAIANPRLWNGIQDPYLYRVYVEIIESGQIKDSLAQSLGLRYFAVDPEKGFLLNGRYLDLHGVSRHQDRIDKGWAIGEKEHREDFDLIKEIGATAVRLAHYQHSQYFYDLCDLNGIVVWAELPLISKVKETDGFAGNAKQQLIELIRQNYSHPSIIFWSIGNELASSDAYVNNLLGELNNIVHTEDPIRITTYAHNGAWGDDPRVLHTDTIGFNRYSGWYYGSYSKIGGWADDIHKDFPGLKIALSEYGAGASVHQHEEEPRRPDPGGSWHPEEYQNLFHEAHWKDLKTRPFIWGKFVWNMFDFASDRRNEGDTPGRNDKGLVTYDRQTKKDSFYWYKANWSSEPFVYITSRRFTDRENSPVNVKIYSNCESVELKVNGFSQGNIAGEDRIFVWKDIALSKGENIVEAIGKSGDEIFTDKCEWRLK